MPQSTRPKVNIAGPLDYLSLEDIISQTDLRERDVPVPEWGGKVRIKELSRGQYVEARVRATPKGGDLDLERWQTELFIRSVITPKFGADRAGQLQDISNAAFGRVITEVLKINGIAAAGEVDEAQAAFPPES